MIKAIIFDCFGVLYPDTFWTMAEEYLGESLQEKRQQLSDLVQQVDLGFITRDGLWARFAEIVGSDKESVYQRLQEFGGLDKRLLKFIEDKKSDYKIGMISNVGQGFIERMFVEKSATEYFDSIILSSSVGLVKPDRRIYELSARELGVEPEQCVFIDDLQKNADGAVGAGMRAIKYDSFAKFIDDFSKLV